ncbi:hypothetical protein GCM10019016_064610 [Streptomyces prasinosporus]|uniref:Uncharacterized protein n=1 Tax=Streptomyces prasinosporus TaxID=68256 RepID=A0ABP6TVJ4_9ACTN
MVKPVSYLDRAGHLAKRAPSLSVHHVTPRQDPAKPHTPRAEQCPEGPSGGATSYERAYVRLAPQLKLGK